MSKLPEDMTLRDWFAGIAMAALISNPKGPDSNRVIAEWSYDMADAMFAARKTQLEAQP